MAVELPVQVDGEPWIQAPGHVVVLRSALKVRSFSFYNNISSIVLVYLHLLNLYLSQRDCVADFTVHYLRVTGYFA